MPLEFPQTKELLMNRHTVISCAARALNVAQQAITWAAVRLLGMAILSVVCETWPVQALMPGFC
ncbi:hypothetical protein O23A_P4p0016 (plasmid) [Aeromonas salmonicida]|nr:hypothetical protein O23A_P4p0016 [Aeromonas salmonicida]